MRFSASSASSPSARPSWRSWTWTRAGARRWPRTPPSGPRPDSGQRPGTAHVERHVRPAIPPYRHDAGVRALDPAVLRQSAQQDAVTPFAQTVEDHAPARGDEARRPAIDSHAETIDFEVGAVGAD